MEQILSFFRKLIPRKIFRLAQPAYHIFWAILGTLIYRFPSKSVRVIGVTGTKGKSTTSEALAFILEQSGHKVALSSTVHFKIAGREIPNLYKMTMPGRMAMQKFLRSAVDAGCDSVVVEMSSEGAKLWRHVGIVLDGLVVTNLSPEHIESHGSFENYREAKGRLVTALARSNKKNTFLVLNKNDEHAEYFAKLAGPTQVIWFDVPKDEPFVWQGHEVQTSLPGHFNRENLTAAAEGARAIGISVEKIVRALPAFTGAKGRVEEIPTGKNFRVIVDYAHTADSMEKLFSAFPDVRKICVFGATGGGRDKWKRPVMGAVADRHCAEIILTDDDSYDEDTVSICNEIATGIKTKTPAIIPDRREAIREGLLRAGSSDIVFITGKGTDPYLMGPNNKKTPWNDAKVVREELDKI